MCFIPDIQTSNSSGLSGTKDQSISTFAADRYNQPTSLASAGSNDPPKSLVKERVQRRKSSGSTASSISYGSNGSAADKNKLFDNF